MLQVIVYRRDFSEILQTPFKLEVESFDWDMVWGPTLATLMSDSVDMNFYAVNLLRCPVKIFNEDGIPVWWGYVHSASAVRNKTSFGVTVENMFNRVHTLYNDPIVDTGWVTADESIAEFGTKEHVEVMTDTTAAVAAARRDRILSEYKYPSTLIEPYASGNIKLILRGWGDTLSWRYVEDPATVLTGTNIQILGIITTYGQFISGAHFTASAGTTTSPFQDGKKHAKEVIENLLKNGTSAGLRMRGAINQWRYYRVEALAAAPSEPDYQMRDDGKLESLSNAPLNEERLELAIAKWVGIKNSPATIGSFSGIHPFLVESASWQRGRGATYKPVGQTDALTLSNTGVS